MFESNTMNGNGTQQCSAMAERVCHESFTPKGNAIQNAMFWQRGAFLA
jgi:hypothetical protein